MCTYRRTGLNEDVETPLTIKSPLRCDHYHLSLHEAEFSGQKLALGKHADRPSQLSPRGKGTQRFVWRFAVVGTINMLSTTYRTDEEGMLQVEQIERDQGD